MLVVRAEQFEKIIKASEEDFVNYLVGYVEGNHPEAAAERDEKTLRKMIRGGIKRAERYQIERVVDTEIFVGKMFEVAPNFDEQAEIKAILTDETNSPEKRVEILRSPSVAKESWEEARLGYDEKAWFEVSRKKPKSPK